MPTRKDFLKTGALAAAGLVARPLSISSLTQGGNRGVMRAGYTSKRPKPSERLFTSKAVEATIKEVTKALPNPKLAWLFENCFPNTLDTTVEFEMKNGRPDTFVITGDIKAMWLRDSSAQVWPYLPLTPMDNHLRQLIAGVINRQTRCILIDPYANAFNKKPTGSEWDSDHTEMSPWLHERKWEIDSLCYTVRLAHRYWKTTGDTSVFDADWKKAVASIVSTFRQQQRKHDHGPYHFQRVTANPYDTQSLNGYGNPVNPVGLICSMFRPSDDATLFPFLIPSNAFAMVSLRQLAEISQKVTKDGAFATECDSFAGEVEQALKRYALSEHDQYGKIIAYETDGFGNHLFMDDANVPDLLGLPYLGYLKKDDPLYKQTRAFVLSTSNPFFFKGTAAEGIGSPHTGLNRIWPIGITMRALTSTDESEMRHCIDMLLQSTADTGFMHESFDKDDPAKFSRSWFAWANTLFGEMILNMYHEHPKVLGI